MLIEAIDEAQQPLIDDGSTGVETEDTSGQITHPFDPTKIRINPATLTVDLLLQRINDRALDMSPGFQRKGGIWTDGAQSRLIESMLIRIPIPALYVDATDDEHWLIVDGLQRLTALHRFMTTGELKLQGLEFFTALDGKRFADLEARYQRRIKETQLILYKIEEGTPPNVKFNIFKRINTGGLPLSAQEIRHALNQGAAIAFLAELAGSREFKRATDNGISDKRMADQECVLRYIAFTMMSYRTSDLDTFLNEAMASLNQMSSEKRTELAGRFRRVMVAARDIFEKEAFRKRYSPDASRSPINKALFEAWSVNLDRLSDADLEQLKLQRAVLMDRFVALMNKQDFSDAVSYATGDSRKVTLRFERIQQLIQEVLSE
jgi:hypothetical protein